MFLIHHLYFFFFLNSPAQLPFWFWFSCAITGNYLSVESVPIKWHSDSSPAAQTKFSWWR
jgi:hypothetical protein